MSATLKTLALTCYGLGTEVAPSIWTLWPKAVSRSVPKKFRPPHPEGHSLLGPASGARAFHLSRVVPGAIFFCSQKLPCDLQSFPCVWEWGYAHCTWESNSPLLVCTNGGAHVLAHTLLTLLVSTGTLKRLTTRMARPRPAGPEPQEPRPKGLDPTMLPTPTLELFSWRSDIAIQPTEEKGHIIKATEKMGGPIREVEDSLPLAGTTPIYTHSSIARCAQFCFSISESGSGPASLVFVWCVPVGCVWPWDLWQGAVSVFNIEISLHLCTSVADQLTRTAENVVQLRKRISTEGDTVSESQKHNMVKALEEAINEAQHTLQLVAMPTNTSDQSTDPTLAIKLQDKCPSLNDLEKALAYFRILVNLCLEEEAVAC
uniref:Uncharacterized protein n=1 Tax=Timema cristinae TaxID=61476 RepID=A0A7R9CV25_TIMCR|nr:unnamed protein product [Timema cristinae]